MHIKCLFAPLSIHVLRALKYPLLGPFGHISITPNIPTDWDVWIVPPETLNTDLGIRFARVY